jgi:prepilin-type processing-associated H-X9-DG protein
MICTQCGKNNPEGATFCAFCAAAIGARRETPDIPPPFPAPLSPEWSGAPAPTTSGLAIASLVFGVLGFITLGITGLIGLILGIVALIKIGGSRGALRGEGLAIAGIVVSALNILFVPVMAAILFPVFMQAREAERVSECLSHVKQIDLGIMAYAQDYDERYPRGDNWCDGILPYVKNFQVYQCPNLPDAKCGNALNAGIAGHSPAEILSPAQTVLTFESHGGWNVSSNITLAEARHRGGLNIGFTDGHVKWMRLENAQPSLLIWDLKAQSAPGSRMPSGM